MMVLTIRTDKPQAEVGLYDIPETTDGEESRKASQEGSREAKNSKITLLAYESWLAHRQLAETLLTKISQIVQSNGKDLSDIGGLVTFQGPGSFTGLRIGLTVANTLAYAQSIPIVGTMNDESVAESTIRTPINPDIADNSDSWINCGLRRLQNGESDLIALPVYGAEANITLPRK